MFLLPSLLQSLPHLACAGGEVEHEEEEEEEEEAEISSKWMNEIPSISFPLSLPPLLPRLSGVDSPQNESEEGITDDFDRKGEFVPSVLFEAAEEEHPELTGPGGLVA